MSGEVLYRKWRPPRFADIVGQRPIMQTLTQAVATGRTSHAYLLCGPRGTGKTSTARVLAKALNCTNRPDGVGDPCGTCETCTAIEKGNFIDLIEIDAASNRGIDEMRDLREKVRFSPTIGRYKVYIIDEAHALTNDAFNAFLKTLEEPPPHTVFVLATTEPHRLPSTIVSRCQRFDFHRISPNDVVERLREIAASEGVDVAPEVLRTIARASSGSLRDATNLLDQLITSFGASFSLEQVRELLGMGGEDRALALVKHLLTGNTTQALELINTVAGEGLDLRPLHRMSVDFLRAALLIKTGVKDALELSKEAHSELSFAASGTSMEHILRALRLFGQLSLKYDQPSPLPLELATVELSLPSEVAAMSPAPAAVAPQPRPRPQQAPPEPQRPTPSPANVAPQPRPRPQQQPPETQRPAPSPANVGPQPRPQQPQRPALTPANVPAANAAPPPPPPAHDPSAPPEERLVAQWPTILRALSRVPRRRFDVAALLRSSTKRQIQGNTLVVRFAHTSNSERLADELDDPRCRIEVERILTDALGEDFTLRLETDDSRLAARAAGEPGHLVRAAMSLGGQVVPTGVASEPTAEPVAAPEPTPPEATEPTAVAAAPADATAIAGDEPSSATNGASPVAEPEPTAAAVDEPTALTSEPLLGGSLSDGQREPVAPHVPSSQEPPRE
jgi:DNA polymerase-3 subunit gamma/tau